MNFDMAMQLLRYALLTIGPTMASHGWTTEAQWQLVTGAIITIATFGWGVYVNWGSTKVPDAHAAQADVPTVNPVTGATKEGPGL